ASTIADPSDPNSSSSTADPNSTNAASDSTEEALIEDEDLPVKQRPPKPRLPPTGKISMPRKRPLQSQGGGSKKKKKLNPNTSGNSSNQSPSKGGGGKSGGQ